MRIEKVNIIDKLARIREHWRPKIVGELNGQEIKLVKFKGEFVWHHHQDADEMFYAIDGSFRIEFLDKVVELQPGEFLIVPRGVEHRTVADEEVAALVFERAATRNTGNVENEIYTSPVSEHI